MKRSKEIRKTTKKNFLKIKNNEQEIVIVQEVTEFFESHHFKEDRKESKQPWKIKLFTIIQILLQIIRPMF